MDEAGEALARELSAEGIAIHAGATVQRIEGGPGAVRVEALVAGRSLRIESEQLLVATGRRASTAGMDHEEAGIRLGPGCPGQSIVAAGEPLLASGSLPPEEPGVATGALGISTERSISARRGRRSSAPRLVAVAVAVAVAVSQSRSRCRGRGRGRGVVAAVAVVTAAGQRSCLRVFLFHRRAVGAQVPRGPRSALSCSGR